MPSMSSSRLHVGTSLSSCRLAENIATLSSGTDASRQARAVRAFQHLRAPPCAISQGLKSRLSGSQSFAFLCTGHVPSLPVLLSPGQPSQAEQGMGLLARASREGPRGRHQQLCRLVDMERKLPRRSRCPSRVQRELHSVRDWMPRLRQVSRGHLLASQKKIGTFADQQYLTTGAIAAHRRDRTASIQAVIGVGASAVLATSQLRLILQ